MKCNYICHKMKGWDLQRGIRIVSVCSKTALCTISAVEVFIYSVDIYYHVAGPWNIEVSRRLLFLFTWGILWRKHVRRHWAYPFIELSSISEDPSLFYLIITSQQDMEYRQGEGRWWGRGREQAIFWLGLQMFRKLVPDSSD